MNEAEACIAAFEQLGIEFERKGKNAKCTKHDDENPSAYLIEGSWGDWGVSCGSPICPLHPLNEGTWWLSHNGHGAHEQWDERAMEINRFAYDAIVGVSPTPMVQLFLNRWHLGGVKLIWDDGQLIGKLIDAGATPEELVKYKYQDKHGRSLVKNRIGFPYIWPLKEGGMGIVAIKFRALDAQPPEHRYAVAGRAGKMPVFLPDQSLGGRVIFFGGEKDSLVARIVCNLRGAVGLPTEMATPSEACMRLLKEEDRDAVVWLDNDSTGAGAADSFAQRCANRLEREVLLVRWRNDGIGKDISDVVRHLSKRGEDVQAWAEEMLRGAEPVQPNWEEVEGQKIEKTLSDAEKLKRKNARKVIGALLTQGTFLRDRVGFEYYFSEKAHKLYNLRETQMAEDLLFRFDLNPQEPLFKFVHGAVRKQANLRGDDVQVHLMWHSTNDAYYIYDNAGGVWKITADSIEQVPNGTDGVMFAHLEGYEPILKAKVNEEHWCELIGLPCFTDTGLLSAEEQRRMLALFIIGMAHGRRRQLETPFLNVLGPQGSGKSAILRMLGLLWFGEGWEVTSAGDKEEDFWILLDKRPFLGWDNADRHQPWYENAIACQSTGGTHERRELFTTDRPKKIEILNYLAITSREPKYRRPDVAARAWMLCLRERPERVLGLSGYKEYVLERRQGALWYLFEMLQQALAEPKTPSDSSLKIMRNCFRMTDWIKDTVGVALSNGVGEEQYWVSLFKHHAMVQADFVLSRYEWWPAFMMWLEAGGWVENSVLGTATDSGQKILSPGELLSELTAIEEERVGGPIGYMGRGGKFVELSPATLGKILRNEEVIQALKHIAQMEEIGRDAHQHTFRYAFKPAWVKKKDD